MTVALVAMILLSWVQFWAIGWLLHAWNKALKGESEALRRNIALLNKLGGWQ